MTLLSVAAGAALGLLSALLLIYVVARRRSGNNDTISQESINSWFRKRR